MRLVFLFFAILGIPAAIAEIILRRRASRRLRVKGIVLKSDVRKKLGNWGPGLLVTYTVDGVEYTTDRLLEEYWSPTESEAERYAARYPLRSEVTLAVDPERHDRAFIDPERERDWMVA